MDRVQFERLRDLDGKVIQVDIRLLEREEHRPFLSADEIRIENTLGHEAKLNIRYNPRRGSTTFNVCVTGIGPICRLDVNGTVHGKCGRTHKHFLLTPLCPENSLHDGVEARSELEGQSVKALFTTFCTMARIRHDGNFILPDEWEGG